MLVLKNIQSKLNKTASQLLSPAMIRAQVLIYSVGYHHTAHELQSSDCIGFFFCFGGVFFLNK